jgi:hypothetical protein
MRTTGTPPPHRPPRRRRRPVGPSILAAVLAAAAAAVLAGPGLPAPALAGTICGAVTDAQTGQPVAQAGVFVRENAGGAYTGWHAASDSQGD